MTARFWLWPQVRQRASVSPNKGTKLVVPRPTQSFLMPKSFHHTVSVSYEVPILSHKAELKLSLWFLQTQGSEFVELLFVAAF